MRLAKNAKQLENFPTKRKPGTTTAARVSKVTIYVPTTGFDVQQINIEDIDDFVKAHDVARGAFLDKSVSEEDFKNVVAATLKIKDPAKDWGGERNDLYTGKLRVNGARMGAAFAFKGPGQRPPLTPGKMGKNGDQIQRLVLQSPAARAFFVQFWNRIELSVLEQLEALARVRSVIDQRRVYFGVIDGQDSERIYRAYGTTR